MTWYIIQNGWRGLNKSRRSSHVDYHILLSEEEALARQAALALKEDQLSEDLVEGTSDIDDETVPETSSEVTDVTETSADLSEEGLTESGDADLEETVAALQDIFTESLAKGLQDILEENGYTGPGRENIHGLVQDCNISSVWAMEIL